MQTQIYIWSNIILHALSGIKITWACDGEKLTFLQLSMHRRIRRPSKVLENDVFQPICCLCAVCTDALAPDSRACWALRKTTRIAIASQAEACLVATESIGASVRLTILLGRLDAVAFIARDITRLAIANFAIHRAPLSTRRIDDVYIALHRYAFLALRRRIRLKGSKIFQLTVVLASDLPLETNQSQQM